MVDDDRTQFLAFLERRLPGDEINTLDHDGDVAVPAGRLRIVVSRYSEALRRTITVELPVFVQILGRWEKWFSVTQLIESKFEAVEERG